MFPTLNRIPTWITVMTFALAAGAGAWLALFSEHTFWALALLFTAMGFGLAFSDVLTDALMVEEGRPHGLTGAFQAIQHKAADMVTDVDGARFIMYRAAWSVDQDEAVADMNVHMAKAWCSEATRRVVAHGQQIHGGIGFTKDYKIQLYFRRQKASELAWGDADYHRELVAEELAV